MAQATTAEEIMGGSLLETFDYLFDELPDARVKNWPFLGDPLTVIAIVFAWLVWVTKIGPTMMSTRKPYTLKSFMVVINLFQVIANVYVTYEFLDAGWLKHYSVKCTPCDHSKSSEAMRMARATYIYLLLKLIDLIDTVVYVLRRKSSQVTFLHLYHHVSTLYLAWVVANYAPGGHGTFVQLMNTIIHAIMYSYYFLASLGPAVQKYLWWKRYLTRLQMLQFVIGLTQNANAIRINCAYPHPIIYMFLPIVAGTFALFANFYVKTYLEKREGSERPKRH